MTAPTQVWVVMQKDRQGKPRGFEKSQERFHLVEGAAEAERKRCPSWLQGGLVVKECVIMGVEEYEHLAGVR